MISESTKTDKYKIVRWLLLATILVTNFIVPTGGFWALAAYLLPTIFVFMHGARYLGKRNIIAFFIIVCSLSFITEYLGVHTGIIFGQYYYNAINNGPLIAGVPPLVTLTYFSIAYGAFIVGRILLGQYGLIRGWLIAGYSMLGALLMSVTDLTNDPTASTINRVYIWTQNGAFFGVPYQNFIGWLAETFVIFIVVSIIFGYISKAPKPKFNLTRSFLLEVVIFYAIPSLVIILRPLSQPQPADIRQSLSLIALFAIGIPVITCILRLFVVNKSPAKPKLNS